MALLTEELLVAHVPDTQQSTHESEEGMNSEPVVVPSLHLRAGQLRRNDSGAESDSSFEKSNFISEDEIALKKREYAGLHSQIQSRELELQMLRQRLQQLKQELLSLKVSNFESSEQQTLRDWNNLLAEPEPRQRGFSVLSESSVGGVSWLSYMKSRDSFNTKTFQLLIRQGVPMELRQEIWQKCVRVHRFNQRTMYKTLLLQSNVIKAPFLKQIEQDVNRTLPEHSTFAPGASGILPLKRMLLAYSRRNPEIGYCQGLSMIAAGLLLHMEEEQAYWSFCAIIENFLPRNYFTPGMIALMADQLVLDELVQERLPDLKAHFDMYFFDLAMVSVNWFMTLFVDSCPLETTFRIWDVFMSEGMKTLFGLSLAILRLHRNSLLTIHDPGTMSIKLKQITRSCYSCQPLLDLAFNEMKTMSNRALAQMRKRHLERLRLRSNRRGTAPI